MLTFILIYSIIVKITIIVLLDGDIMSVVKRSRQREAILSCLKERYDHPTADEIYQSVTKLIPNISLGTVYRNLTFLAEQGQIIKLSTGFGADHFDAVTKPHFHFVCNECGSVTDIAAPVSNHAYIEEMNKEFEGEITGFKLMFYGRCKCCVEKKKAKLA